MSSPSIHAVFPACSSLIFHERPASPRVVSCSLLPPSARGMST